MAIVAPLVLGAVLRVRQWQFARSFWLDELYLLQEIVARTPRDLVGTFESSQSAPIGFLWWAKACESLLGAGELSMRMPSLVAGLLLLVIAARLASLLLRPLAAVAVTILVATNERLIYYSVELKQYGVDALWSTLLVMLLVDVIRADDRRWPLNAWTAAAVAAPWMSHASIIVAAVTGIVIAHRTWTDRRAELGLVGLSGIAVLMSLATVFELQLRGISSDPVLQGYWEEGFAPRPWTGDMVRWAWNTWSAFATDVVQMSPAVVLLALSIAGLTLPRLVERRITAVVALLALAVIVLAATEVYPARDRLLLFVVPLTLVLAVAGVERLATLSWAPGALRVGSVILGVAVAAPGVVTGVAVLVEPITRSETQRVVAEIARLAEPGDVIVTSVAGYVPLVHYGREAGLGPDLVVLRSEQEGCSDDAALLPRSGRIWLVFGYHLARDPDPIGTLGPWFDGWGERRHAITAPLASAYLYEAHPPGVVEDPPSVSWCVEVVDAP